MDEILRKKIEAEAENWMMSGAFEAGAEFALSHQWISIDEALPDDWEYVLVVHKSMSGARNKISIAYLHSTAHSKKWNVEGFECCLNKTNPDDNIVYAWMPIPELNLK